MKKITFYLIGICLLLTFHPLQSKAEAIKLEDPPTMLNPKPTEAEEVKALLLRLDEINAIDKSNLKSPEKRALRKEVRSIKQNLNNMGGGVYISVGTVIIIVILLIILL